MIFLAVRYLLERKRQTILTLLGVFFGAMAYVSVSGFFIGFQSFMVEQLVNNTAQIHIQARQDTLKEHELDKDLYGSQLSHVFWRNAPAGLKGFFGVQNPQEWYVRLASDPRVEAYSPIFSAPVIFTLANRHVSASLTGCDPQRHMYVTSIADYMQEGKLQDLSAGGNRVILGDELMRRLGAGMDQYVLVSVGATEPVPFKVVGHFQFGNRGADLMAYGALNDVQRVNHTPNRVTEIAVRLKDYTQAESMALAWKDVAPELTESWDQQNANILQVFKIQTALRFAMIMTVLIVAGFGIYNVLNMTVTQKRQDIAILRSMGYDTLDVVGLFFSQGLILGIVGAILGLIAGYGFCRFLQTLTLTRISATNPQGHLQISMDIAIYYQATALALFASSLASVLPARAAGKLTPIEIIRAGA